MEKEENLMKNHFQSKEKQDLLTLRESKIKKNNNSSAIQMRDNNLITAIKNFSIQLFHVLIFVGSATSDCEIDKSNEKIRNIDGLRPTPACMSEYFMLEII